jgi:flagellar biosynthesis protein FlhG
VIQASGVENLDIISSGPIPPNPSELLGNGKITNLIKYLKHRYDYIIFDMGAGITTESLQLILACNEIILVTLCEPTAMTDAYSALKFVHHHNQDIPFQLVINRALNTKHANKTAGRLQSVTQQFLKRDLFHLGSLPDDKYVTKAVMEQAPFVIKYPTCQASRGLEEIATRYLNEGNSSDTKNTYTFMYKLRGLFR